MLKYFIYCWNLLKREKDNCIRYLLSCFTSSIIKHLLSTQYIYIVYLILKNIKNIDNVKYYILGGQAITCILSVLHSKLLQHIVKKEIFFYQHIVSIQYKYILDRVTNNASYDWITQHSKKLESQLIIVSNDLYKLITKFHKLIYVITHTTLCIIAIILINPIISIINIIGLLLVTSFLIKRERQSEHIKKSCNETFLTLNDSIRNYCTIMFDTVLNGESRNYMSNICTSVRNSVIEQNKGIYFDNDTYYYVNYTILILYSVTLGIFMWLFQSNFADNISIFLLIRASFNNLDYFISLIMEWYVELKQYAINFDKLDDTFNATHFKRIIPKQYDLTSKFVLKINTLSFNYPNFSLNSSDIKISYKDKIIVNGISGSGKTTFIKLFRYILIPNNVDLELVYKDNKYKLEDGFGNISQSIVYCSQSGVTFVNGTLQEIITNNNYNQQIYDQVCKLTNIPLHFNNNNVDVSHISGGELQRINIAKTLYRAIKQDAKILIFDESDSNLDNQSSKKIYDNIFELFKKKLIIIIAHSDNIKQRTDFTKEILINNGNLIMQIIN